MYVTVLLPPDVAMVRVLGSVRVEACAVNGVSVPKPNTSAVVSSTLPNVDFLMMRLL